VLLKARKQGKLARKLEEDYILERCNELPAGWKGALFDILTLPGQNFSEAREAREQVRTMRGIHSFISDEANDEVALKRFCELFDEFRLEDWQRIMVLRHLGVLRANKRYRNLP